MAPYLKIILFYVYMNLPGFTWANLNLFMNEAEVKRLLGLQAELYYVREGAVNSYAMGFSVPIPADISDLHFSWQSLKKSPPEMHYIIELKTENKEALGIPKLNITEKGPVPTKLSVFKITLPCTGQVSAEVEVIIQLNISIFSPTNITSLNFKRKKICLKDTEKKYSEDVTRDSFTRDNPEAAATSDGSSTNIFYIAVGCACATIVVIGLSVGIYYVRSRKTRRNERISEPSSSPGISNQGHTFLRVDTPNNASSSGTIGVPCKGAALEGGRCTPQSQCYSSVRRFSPAPVMSDLRPVDIQEKMNEIRVERNKISLRDLILEGTFGQIYHGYLLGDENEVGTEQDVFIKTVTDQASQHQIQLLLAESMMMFGLSHKNIQSILAVCLDNETQPLVLFPYLAQGNLKKFLLKCKVTEGHSHTLLTHELVDMAVQIIRGIQYIHKKKVIHKDLATRNCVIDEQLNVKITDNALSRDLFPNDYHCLGDNENRPVRWLAIESLVHKQFSTASDVWAFGVALWELMTLGQQPYVEIDPFEMAAYLKDGFRLSQPINCPDELFAVMACCWALAPEERPTFAQLLVCLQDFYTALGRYI